MSLLFQDCLIYGKLNFSRDHEESQKGARTFIGETGVSAVGRLCPAAATLTISVSSWDLSGG